MTTPNQGDYLYQQNISRGALFVLASAFVFSFVGILVKLLSTELPIPMVVFFRSAGGLLFVIPMILAQQNLSLKTGLWMNHSARAVSGVTAMYLFFFAMANLPLAEAIALNFTSPMIVPIMAYLLLRERLPSRIWLMLMVGFMGVLLILKPGYAGFNTAAWAGFASAFFASFALVNVRKLTRTEPATRIVFYFSLIASLLTLVPMLMVWQTPNLTQLGMLISIGLLATIGQWLLTRGYASGPVGQIGFFHYSSVIFAGVFDWLIWNARLDHVSLAGIILIIIAGIVAMRTSAPEHDHH